jgi:ABC-type molybdenum transport system ATPase subunit/photorepair protein PhrA
MTEQKRCKIVIFGAFGVGKTTLIKTIDPDSHHVEAHCSGGTTTVSLDFGRIQMNEVIYIYLALAERVRVCEEIINKAWMAQSSSSMQQVRWTTSSIISTIRLCKKDSTGNFTKQIRLRSGRDQN